MTDESKPKQNRGKDKTEEEYERLRIEFASWLLDPTRTASTKEWAEEHGLNEHTLAQWKKRKDVREQMQAWREEMRSHLPDVVTSVFQRAVRGDLNAARLIGDWFGLNAPKDLNLNGRIEAIAYMPKGALVALATEVIEGEVIALPETAEGDATVDAQDSEYPVPAAPVPGEGPPVTSEVPSGGGGTAER